MASTIGHARGSTHGSCRPLPRIFVSWPSRVTVSCSCPIVDIGLNATRTMIVSP
eukprot:CAMPEP_0205937756 /NCGR_PEP_ID=MMETSP1325-20131115/44997_1 /ASSEMBLY_ACC=CAM_ASM_000708 /TAXON_ID=236786 /ORGANISM="Florenciella sp., Strain RCC1007" /LENGTH=53 /DNA_ID=CAMNT_0053308055 /DNA_START=14 /DNA_END=171 /DNA_ORIENTATION=+